jgi:hypothetical protein
LRRISCTLSIGMASAVVPRLFTVVAWNSEL